MSTVQTKQRVDVNAVQEALSAALGSSYRVTVASDSTLKVGRPGVIPAKLKLSWSGDTTTFKVTTTGLILSRIVQAWSINPRVQRALQESFPTSSG